jgi:hypothetical protein
MSNFPPINIQNLNNSDTFLLMTPNAGTLATYPIITWQDLKAILSVLYAEKIDFENFTHNIVPAESTIINIGSATRRVNHGFFEHLDISNNSLSMNGINILSSSADTMDFKADVDQHMTVRTQGGGTLLIKSQNILNFMSENSLQFSSNGTSQITTGGGFVVNGAGMTVNGASIFNGDVTVAGNFVFQNAAKVFEVETLNATIKDNIIVINKGQIGATVTAGYAGFLIDRGDGLAYRILFSESDGSLICGFHGSESKVALFSDLTRANIGLGSVDNTSDADKNVLSATKLTTARNIAISGDASGTVSFDGTQNVSIEIALQNITDSGSGNLKKISIDNKGRVIGTQNVAESDITSLLGTGSVTNTMLANSAVANLSGTNTGDETETSIKTKLKIASSTTDGYLTQLDWNTFNSKQSALGFAPLNKANNLSDVIDTAVARSNLNVYSKAEVDNFGYQSLSAIKSIFTGSTQYFSADSDFGIWTLCDGRALSRTTYSVLFSMLSFVLAGNTTNASATISNLPSTANLRVGMVLEGSGIPAGTRIASIVNGTSITISANATATATGVSFRFFRNGVGRSDGTTTFTIPNAKGTVLQGIATNTSLTQDFIIASGTQMPPANNGPTIGFGNWFICTGI